MNGTPDLARVRDIADPYGFLSFTCSLCDSELLLSDVVALLDDSRAIACLSCYMKENALTPRTFSRVVKSRLGCESCGFTLSAFALQYDHTNSAEKYRTKSGKVIHPSDLFRTCSAEVFANEIAKCVIRCANCHAIKTAKERGLE